MIYFGDHRRRIHQERVGEKIIFNVFVTFERPRKRVYDAPVRVYL